MRSSLVLKSILAAFAVGVHAQTATTSDTFLPNTNNPNIVDPLAAGTGAGGVNIPFNKVVTILTPQANAVVTTRDMSPLVWSVNSVQSTMSFGDTYPIGMNMDFVWTSTNGSNAVAYSINGTHNLAVNPSINPQSVQNYSDTFTVPPCMFFKRYPNTSWSYNFVFTPVYASGSDNPISIPVKINSIAVDSIDVGCNQ